MYVHKKTSGNELQYSIFCIPSRESIKLVKGNCVCLPMENHGTRMSKETQTFSVVVRISYIPHLPISYISNPLRALERPFIQSDLGTKGAQLRGTARIGLMALIPT